MKKYMGLFLVTVVFLTSIFAGSASAYASTLNGSYILRASGAPTVAIKDKVYAELLNEESAQKWVITPVSASGEDVVTIQTDDRSKAWTVPSDNPDGTQITLEPLSSGSPAPNQIFRIVFPEPDSQDRIYLLTNSSKQYVGRSFIEDRSLLPKRIVVISDNYNAYWLAVPTK